MRSALIPLLLAGGLVVSGCSASTDPIELPQDPPGAVLLESEQTETPVDTIVLAVQAASGSEAELARLLDLGDTDRQEVIAHYDQELTDQGWEQQPDAAVSRALGATWERDGQTLVLAVVTLEGTDIALVLHSPAD